jgi:mannose-6-phosphate isomerase-like protein (cupin superfamily)
MKSEAPCFISSVEGALGLLHEPGSQRFATVFEHGSLVVEIYAPRGKDPQQPHTRDEVYVVAAGSGKYVCGDSRQNFGPGDLLFAAAGVEHRFEDFTNDLTLWVMFYGPEGGESTGGQ